MNWSSVSLRYCYFIVKRFFLTDVAASARILVV